MGCSISIYFPSEIEKKIRELAKKERRSISSQVVYIVEKWLEQNSG